MARWLVQLEGDPSDLERFPHWFPDGDIFFTEENGAFFLTGRALEQLPDHQAVRFAAMRALEERCPFISILSPGVQKPAVGHVLREEDDGKRHSFIFLDSLTMQARGRVGTPTVPGGTRLEATSPTQAQQLWEAARANPRLLTAVSVWAAPGRSWTHLHRIVREIELHLGQGVDKAGLCSAGQRDRLFFTGNTAELSGIDSRHATGELSGRPRPGRRHRTRKLGGMDLGEATSLVRGLLEAALQRS